MSPSSRPQSNQSDPPPDYDSAPPTPWKILPPQKSWSVELQKGATISSHQTKAPTLGNYLNAWFWECLGALTAVGLLVTQFAILSIYSGKQTSTWTAPLGLNTLLAVLSTIARVSLAFVVSEIISQLQWTGKETRLSDLEAFNQASRGAWASFKMLIFSRQGWKRLDLLIALVVVLTSLGMGAFAQQAVQVTDCPFMVRSGTASIPNIHTIGNLPTANSEMNWSTGLKSSSAKAAVLLSLFDPEGNHSAILPTCPTGNCTFSTMKDTNGASFTHRSVGLCSQCTDISSRIQFRREKDEVFGSNSGFAMYRYVWSLPGGLSEVSIYRVGWDESSDHRSGTLPSMPDTNIYLGIGSEDISASDTANFLHVVNYSLASANFLSIDNFNPQEINLTVPEPKEASVSATACSLYPCLKTYWAVVESGRMLEKLVSEEKFDAYSSRSWEPGRDEYGYGRADQTLISARSPCRAAEELYTPNNITTAASPITLSRWALGSDTWNRDGLIREKDWTLNRTGEVNITAPAACLYGTELGYGWFKKAQELLTTMLHGVCGMTDTVFTCLSPQNSSTRSSNSMPSFWLEGFARLPKRTHIELGQFWDKIAESLTRQMRMGKFEVDGREKPGNEWRSDSERETVTGDAWQTATCFAVNMNWLVLSTGITTLTVLILAWTIWHGNAHGDAVWKSSILPLVYHRDRAVAVVQQDEGTVGVPSPSSEPLLWKREMEQDSQMVRVRLGRAEA